MTITRRTLVKSVAGLPFLSLAGRAHAQQSANILRMGLSASPPNLQPWVSTGASAGTVKMLTHRSLVAYDSKGELRGELAQSWAIDGDGAWVFKLRQGCIFHNGEPVTADDVKWSIEQIGAENSTAYMRGQFQAIAKVEIPNPSTVRIVTKQPIATLPHWFANYNTFVIWRKSTANEPVGAGPFRVVAQERGTSIEVAAFDRFYKPGYPKLKGIKFIAYPDENLRTAALMSGDVDMIEYVPWQSMETVEKDQRLKLDYVDLGPFMDVLFNASKPPFNDPRVRRAVAHAVKRDDIVKVAFFGRGKSLEGVPVVPGTPWFDAELSRGWNYDPERSKQLLSAAGYPKGFQTTCLATAQFGMHKDTAEVVQQYLAAIGIQAELKLPDWSTRVAMGAKGQYDISVHGVSADNNDPDGLTVVLDTSLPTVYSRSFQLDAPRTVAALAKGRTEFDQAKRVEIYKEMQRAALEEVPLVGLAWRSQAYGMDKRVKGFTNLPGQLTASSGNMLEETYFG